MSRLWICAFLLSAALAAVADKIVLKDGRKYEGTILEETDTTVKIKLKNGAMSFKREDIETIEKGASVFAEREDKFGALDPSNPRGYLEAAQWLSGPGKELLDDKTIVKLCNIASKIDMSLAPEAQTILGSYWLAKGKKEDAALSFARALKADPGHKPAQEKFDSIKQDMEDKLMKELKQIAEALDMVMADRTKEAIPALRKCEKLAFATRAPGYLKMTIEELADELQKRVPCDVCKGGGRARCTPCNGTGLLRCEDCQGTGKKRTLPKNPTFAQETCKQCWHAGSLLCQGCQAERSAVIHFAREDKKGQKSATVTLQAGVEDVGFRPHIYTQGKWIRRSDGEKVTAIAYGGISKGGTRTCPECRGVKYEAATTSVDKYAVSDFRDAVKERIDGKVPLDLMSEATEVYDEKAVADGLFKYTEGEWTE